VPRSYSDSYLINTFSTLSLQLIEKELARLESDPTSNPFLLIGVSFQKTQNGKQTSIFVNLREQRLHGTSHLS
jgi:hypothetical protein